MAEKSKAVVLSEMNLSQERLAVLNIKTPPQFIKSRPGRGNQKVTYVEGGYVVSVLNRVFGPLNWNFKVIEEKQDPKGISVLGQLAIIDHVKGYRIEKEQYGGSAIKDNVPLSDVRKAAATDSLKKCASLFGVAIDVYWPQLDNVEVEPAPRQTPAQKAQKVESLFEKSKSYINAQTDKKILKQLKERLDENGDFTVAEKLQLNKLLDAKLKGK